MKALGYLFIISGMIVGGGAGIMLFFCLLGSYFVEMDSSFSFDYLLKPSFFFMAGIVVFSFGYRLVYGESPLMSELNNLGLDKLDHSYVKKEDLEIDFGYGLHKSFKIIPLFIASGFLVSFVKTSNLWDILYFTWFAFLSFLLFSVRKKGYFCKYENIWTFAYCIGKKVVAKSSFYQPYIHKIYLDYADYKRSSGKSLWGYTKDRLYELEVHSSKGYLVLYESTDEEKVKSKFKLLDHYYTT